MLKRKDYEAELAKIMGELKKRQDHTQDELDSIGRNIPIRVMQDGKALGKYCMEKNLSFKDSFIILAWVVSQFSFLSDIKVSNDVTYDEACKYYETARVNTIVIHRLNNIMHDAMTNVYDILEREKKMRFAVKREMNNAEKVWNTYIGEHRRSIERSAYYTMLDHLRLASDAVSPYIEKVYEAIRDYMIRLGMRDVEIKARCQVAMLLMKVNGHSFKAFFRDFERESGVDYSKCYNFNNLSAMCGHFVSMCNAIGIKTAKDKYGYDIIDGFDPENNQRFLWAWDDFIKILRDDELMDETAKKAIALNPDIEKEYLHVLNEENEKEVSAELEKLGEKYKIGSL